MAYNKEQIILFKEQIERLEYRMEQRKMWNRYWIAMATTGIAGNRIITDGSGTVITYKEKIKDALDTAARHIRLFEEMGEERIELLKKLWEGEKNKEEIC